MILTPQLAFAQEQGSHGGSRNLSDTAKPQGHGGRTDKSRIRRTALVAIVPKEHPLASSGVVPDDTLHTVHS